MKNKYESIEIDQCRVTVDVSLLSKSDELFFNATEMAKPFNKRPDDFWKQQQNRDYLDALITLSGGNKVDYIFTRTGRQYGGSWYHRDLALQFARWLSPIFAVNLDKWITSRIEQEHIWQRNRLESKTGFLPLTEAIQNAHNDAQFYHFATECDLINRIVLGMSSKQFKEVYGVDNVRDALSDVQLKAISRLQRIDSGLIDIGMSYEDRKQNLIKCYEKDSTSKLKAS